MTAATIEKLVEVRQLTDDAIALLGFDDGLASCVIDEPDDPKRGSGHVCVDRYFVSVHGREFLVESCDGPGKLTHVALLPTAEAAARAVVDLLVTDRVERAFEGVQ